MTCCHQRLKSISTETHASRLCSCSRAIPAVTCGHAHERVLWCLQARRQDHLERAKREEEAPLLLAAYNRRLEVGLCPALSCISHRPPVEQHQLSTTPFSSSMPPVHLSAILKPGGCIRTTSDEKVQRNSASEVDNPSMHDVVLIEVCSESCNNVPPQEDEVRHKAAMEERERQHRAEWETNVSEKQRLAKMRGDEATFRKSIMDRRTAEFEALRVWLLAHLTIPTILASALVALHFLASCHAVWLVAVHTSPMQVFCCCNNSSLLVCRQHARTALPRRRRC